MATPPDFPPDFSSKERAGILAKNAAGIQKPTSICKTCFWSYPFLERIERNLKKDNHPFGGGAKRDTPKLSWGHLAQKVVTLFLGRWKPRLQFRATPHLSHQHRCEKGCGASEAPLPHPTPPEVGAFFPRNVHPPSHPPTSLFTGVHFRACLESDHLWRGPTPPPVKKKKKHKKKQQQKTGGLIHIARRQQRSDLLPTAGLRCS